MRKLIDGTNVDGASGDYPKGRVRDEALPTLGTILNEILVGDIQQFFQKLIIDAGVTENDLPDNVTNGYQLVEALETVIQTKIRSNQDTTAVAVFDIGEWDMDTDSSVTVDLSGFEFDDIVSCKATILSDPDYIADITEKSNLISSGACSAQYNSSTLELVARLYRVDGGTFDSGFYNQTSYNRGWVVVRYKL